jgi:hypothetical protein
MQDYEVPQNSLIPENIHGGFIGWIIEVDSVKLKLRKIKYYDGEHKKKTWVY